MYNVGRGGNLKKDGSENGIAFFVPMLSAPDTGMEDWKSSVRDDGFPLKPVTSDTGELQGGATDR